jgi:CHU_C Type IX secretion signal domain
MQPHTPLTSSSARSRWNTVYCLFLLTVALIMVTCFTTSIETGHARDVAVGTITNAALQAADNGAEQPPPNQSQQDAWRAEVEEGKSARSTLSIKNNCSAPHNFRIENSLEALRFEQQTDEILVAASSSRNIGAVFDATRLRPRVYHGSVDIKCLDCKEEPGCSQDKDRLAVELTVVPIRTATGQTIQDNPELARLYEEEQAEHTASAKKAVEAITTPARRNTRVARVRELYAQNQLRTGIDFYRAAQVLLRGGSPEDYQLGRELSTTAVSRNGSIQALQTGPEQECNGAIPVCQSTYTQSQSYTGVGASQEVIGGTCLGVGETNSVWYTFTASTSGSLTFTINTPNDYDFALYNISNGGCAAIHGQPIRCNYSGIAGTTGLTLPAQPELPNLSVSGAGNPLMPGVNVTAGQTYALLVNNYSANQNGYTLTFGGTASIFDATPPTIQSAAVDEATCTIEITMSEPVRCSSIAADGSDFQMLTSGGPTLTGATGINCGTFTNKIRLTYSTGNAQMCGRWIIGSKAGTDGNTLIDNCGNALATHSTATVVTTPPATANFTLTGDTFCEGAPIIADGSGSLYENKHFWSIVESDANWNVIGPEYSDWFTGPAGTFDVRQFAAQKGLVLTCGKFYRVKLAVSNCCTPWDETVRLIFIRCPPRVEAGPDRTVCSCCGPQKLQIGTPGVPGTTYSWSPAIGLDNPTSPNPTIDFSVFNGTGIPFPSVYEVTATDAHGCTAKDSVYIKTVCGCRPPAKVSVTRANACSRTFTLTADCACGSDTTPSYLWSTGATTQSIEVLGGSGPHTVTCRNECGATVSKPITVPSATPLEGGFPNVQCPNVFTPNGDNVNDLWTVLDTTHPTGFTPAYNATGYELEVRDRWGSRVALLSGSTTTGFANNSIPGWNGTATHNALYSWWQRTFGGRKNTYAGQPVSDGTYFYIFRLRNCTTGLTDVCHGFIHVFR